MIAMFADLQEKRDDDKGLEELQKELRATRKLIKQDFGGANLSFENPVALPKEGSRDTH